MTALDAVGVPIAQVRQRPSDAASFFAAPTYSDWVRAGMLAESDGRPTSALFESTMAEPTVELAEVIRGAFSRGVTDRWVSVFTDGNPFVIKALCLRYGLEPEQLITTTGATGALTLLMKATLDPGDHVLVERPGFDLLSQLARDAGAIVSDLPRPPPLFRIDPATLRALLTPRTRLVLITNLHNPSGVWLEPEALVALAAAAAEVGAILVVDEVYRDFAGETAPPPAAVLAPNIVTVNSLTKVFGLFALKCGWLVAAPDLIERIKQRVPEGDPGVSKLSHAVAAHVLEAPEAFDQHWRRTLATTAPIMRRHASDMVAAGLIEGEVPPFGCMFFPRIVGVRNTRALAHGLWRDLGLLVAPGEYFGLPGYVRLGFGSDRGTLGQGLEKLRVALTVLGNGSGHSRGGLLR